jgi:hypothetical protein
MQNMTANMAITDWRRWWCCDTIWIAAVRVTACICQNKGRLRSRGDKADRHTRDYHRPLAEEPRKGRINFHNACLSAIIFSRHSHKEADPFKPTFDT